ncbi:MAG: tetratricopeptide repeat protein [Phycisphaeraceae bacterium]|nr:tetratricopeptide repeat protein [Phycisphaerales bacterium]MCB9858820.1 tetratricopeptide repeat protein [Phycisphaeraceae bacterium]
MTSDRRHEARRIFMELAYLPADKQSSALAQACAGDDSLRTEVETLLRADAQAGGFMDAPTSDVVAANQENATVAASSRERAGEHIGRYKLLEQIGEGGFGAVWAAEQREPVKRRVALKIIKLGMDTKQVIARFEAERQALAMMDHPNIAKVFDAGMTETGRPFFVMEYIKGVPILEYCDTEKLDTKSRLDLFMKVCHAIQHAHQKGIIHRDIKPNNVLVTMHDGVPVPKVIDFGIAKATNQELTEKTIYTQHRQMIGTPAYMSPEQAEMSGLDIDTRSDIYSLGVLLYELLTGTTPFDSTSLMEAGFAEMMRIIREETPHKPSTRLSSLGETGTRTAEQRRVDIARLSTILRGDLDWIVMKCLEKDRTRRYETANGLAADIERHLNDEPVLAGPPSASYRLRKFVRRNRGQVIAGGIVAGALVLGIFGTTWGLIESRTQAAIAQRRGDNLQQVVDFQSEQFSTVVPELMGADLRSAIIDAAPEDSRAQLKPMLSEIDFTGIGVDALRQHIFDPSAEKIEEQFSDQPLVRAQLYHALGERLLELGLLDPAEQAATRAVQIRTETLGASEPLTLDSTTLQADVLVLKGEFEDAERLFRQVEAHRRRVLGDEHPDTLKSIANVGHILHERSVLDEAETVLRTSVDAYRRVLGNQHEDTLATINWLAQVLRARGNYDEAEKFYLEALEGRRMALGDNHHSTIQSINNLGALYISLDRSNEAEDQFRRAYEAWSLVSGTRHPDTQAAYSNLGMSILYQAVDLKRGRVQGVDPGDDPDALLDESEGIFRAALEESRRTLGDAHPDTLRVMGGLALTLKARGQLDESAELQEHILKARRRILGDDHQNTLNTLGNLASIRHAQGRLEEAGSLYQAEYVARLRTVGDTHPFTLSVQVRIARVRESQGRLDEACEMWREIAETRQRSLGGDHPQTLSDLDDLAQILLKAENFDETAAVLEVLIERRRSQEEDSHLAFSNLTFLGSVHEKLGKFAEAEAAYREAFEGYRRIDGENSERALPPMIATGVALNALERYEESETFMREAIETASRVLGADHWRVSDARTILGAAIAGQRRFDEAELLLLAGHAALEASLPTDLRAEKLPPATQRLVDLYEAWDRPMDAEDWRKRVGASVDDD